VTTITLLFMFEQCNAELRSRSRLCARLLFWQPEEVNADIAPDSLNDQQCYEVKTNVNPHGVSGWEWM
jgi:hypothetical protein